MSLDSNAGNDVRVATCVCNRSFKSVTNAVSHKASSPLSGCSNAGFPMGASVPQPCVEVLAHISGSFQSFLLKDFVMGRTCKQAKGPEDKWLLARVKAANRSSLRNHRPARDWLIHSESDLRACAGIMNIPSGILGWANGNKAVLFSQETTTCRIGS